MIGFRSPLIMIVEDDEHVRGLLVRAITRWFPGARVIDLASAEQAVEQLRTEMPRVLVTDYLLPGITGLALAEQVRTTHNGTAILLLSALSLDGPALQSVDHFLAKPLAMTDLRSVLDGMLGLA